MSFPAQGMESVYRNRLPDVARLLQSKHGDKYLIINVSDRSYDTKLFNDQVGVTELVHHSSIFLAFTIFQEGLGTWLLGSIRPS